MRERDIIGLTTLLAAMLALSMQSWVGVALVVIGTAAYVWLKYSDGKEPIEAMVSKFNSLENEVKALKSALALKR
jgi:hypothetical protein